MTNKEESIGPIRKLRKRLEDACTELDTKLDQFVLIPGDESRPDLIQVVIFVEADALLTIQEKEQKKFDEQFSAIEKDFLEDPADVKARKIREGGTEAVKEMFKFDDD